MSGREPTAALNEINGLKRKERMVRTSVVVRNDGERMSGESEQERQTERNGKEAVNPSPVG